MSFCHTIIPCEPKNMNSLNIPVKSKHYLTFNYLPVSDSIRYCAFVEVVCLHIPFIPSKYLSKVLKCLSFT